jgi:putative pyoverdin transport system ATP-binding/permease protein
MKAIRNLIAFLSVLMQWTRSVRHSRAIIVGVVLTGVISGLGNTALIAIINTVLSGNISPTLLWSFIGICIIIPVFGFASQILLIGLALKAGYNMRMWLSHHILSTPLRLLEDIGVHRLFASLTDDIPTVTEGITNLPILFKQVVIITGCLIYVGWLSRPLLFLVLIYMFLGVLSYQLPLVKSTRYFRLMREQGGIMLKAFRALTEGTKELKLHRPRRQAFISQHLEPAMDSIRRYGLRGHAIGLAANHWGLILFFVLIGLTIFGAATFLNVGRQALTGFTLTILYMNGPLSAILNTLPNMSRAHVAFQKISELGLSLDSQAPENESPRRTEQNISWDRLELVGVTHTYHLDGGMHEFTLGPLDLTFHRGEIVFLIGGNGSGKTTLAKLLVGLYVPESGQIRLNGKTTTQHNRDDYRQHFSAIFSDSYIFEDLLGLDETALDTKAGEYLSRLQLSHKVKVVNGTLSTVNLSKGQRKRLALLTAYLEDRLIYLFDEWAADQDITFKEIFYCQILPELKARGKTVLVISHDERYYNVADRIIRLDYGKLATDQRRVAFGT